MRPPFEVLSVTDSREWVIGAGDRWEPVDGSGDPRGCDRCGRTHLIHATVRDVDGAEWVVGVGCMNAGDAGAVRRMRNAAAATAKLRALSTMLPPFPNDRVRDDRRRLGRRMEHCLTVDGLAVPYDPRNDSHFMHRREAYDQLKRMWFRARAAELLGGESRLRRLERSAGLTFHQVTS